LCAPLQANQPLKPRTLLAVSFIQKKKVGLPPPKRWGVFFARKRFNLPTELPLGPVLRRAFAEKMSLRKERNLV
jgi:hypothetical protein